MTDAPSYATYILVSADPLDLPNSRILIVAPGLQLNDLGAGVGIVLEPTGKLGALQDLAVNGFIAMTSSTVLNTRQLTSLGTIDITNPAGVAGNPILDVVNNTNVQKINFEYNGAGIAAQRHTLNFIPGSNTGITVSDDSGNDRVNVTISAIGGGGGGTNSKYYLQQIDTAASFSSTVAPRSFGHFPFTLPSAELLNFIRNGDGGTGELLVTANVSLSLIYTGSLPFFIPFDITTDANLPVSLLYSGGQTYYVNSKIITTPQTSILKSLNLIADVSATKLVLSVFNPDFTNSMTLQNFIQNVNVQYFPEGY